MAYVGDAELVRIAVGLRKAAYEHSRESILQSVLEPIKTKVAVITHPYQLAIEHYALFLHVTRP
jgi:hypothetical protein